MRRIPRGAELAGLAAKRHQLQRLRKKVLVIRHLNPVGITAAVLFGLASEIEIRPEAPIVDGLNSVEKSGPDATRQVRDRVLVYILISQQDAKEKRRLTCRIGSQTVRDMNHLRPEML
jgi:hypothetical protein